MELRKPKPSLKFKEENKCFKTFLNLRCFVNTTFFLKVKKNNDNLRFFQNLRKILNLRLFVNTVPGSRD